MPSKSKAQHNLMNAVAHNKKFAKKVGISQNVGKEFVAADRGKHFKESSDEQQQPSEDTMPSEHQDEQPIALNQGLELTEKLKQIMIDNELPNAWEFPAVQKSLQDAYNMGKEDEKAGKVYPESPEQEVEETIESPLATGKTNWGPKTRKMIDDCLRLTSDAKTSEDRRDIVSRYAEEHGVSEQDLYNAISQETGTDYFSKDDYMTGVEFDHFDEAQRNFVKSILESYKNSI